MKLDHRNMLSEGDDPLLAEIEHWRDLLARNLALRNPDLKLAEMNFAVQVTLDRILFLRICEERGLEPEGRLRELLSGGQIYTRLCDLFRQAERRYTSGLFHFKAEKGSSSPPDSLTLRIKADDRALARVIRGLYSPSPFVFSEIPVEILGQVYERFLGNAIRLTPAHQARIEEKPGVRAAGGVYPASAWIVAEIVKNTVGRLVEGKTPQETQWLKILDPACGSGSFLLEAYQYLLDWHLKWYSLHDPVKYASDRVPEIYRPRDGGWKLTIAEKKRILLNNIKGVDIDPQAVEVTRFLLSLKVLEGESGKSLESQLDLSMERLLPDLGLNIQCGNSLIGPDYYGSGQLSMKFWDEQERSRVNAFNWRTAFPQIFIAGGFDAVIGNPPYKQIRMTKESAPVKGEYFRKNYITASKGMDNKYAMFVEKGLELLNKNGRLGFLLPADCLSVEHDEGLQKLISERKIHSQTIDLDQVEGFKQSTVATCLLFLNG